MAFWNELNRTQKRELGTGHKRVRRVTRYGPGGSEKDPWIVIATKEPPWTTRGRNRKRNKLARASRRRNRE